MKKFLSILLVSMLFISLISVNVYSTNTTPSIKDIDINTSIEEAKKIGKEPQNPKGYCFNYHIYKDFYYDSKIIYGNSLDISNNENKYSEETGRIEYRYLGFNISGEKVTNEKFPNDYSGTDNPKYWRITNNGPYVNSEEASESWNDLKRSSSVHYQYNRKMYLKGNGLNYSDKWSSTDWGGIDKTQLLTKAGLLSGGTVKVQHKRDSGTYYGTFDSEPIPHTRTEKLLVNNTEISKIVSNQTELNGTRDTDKAFNLTIPYSAAEVTFKTDINGIIDIDKVKAKLDGFNLNDLIDEYKVEINSYKVNGHTISINKSNTSNSLSSNLTKNITIDRQYLNVGKNIVNINWKVTLTLTSEKTFSQDYISKITIFVEENNSAPISEIIADDIVYVGDKVDIVGIGTDTVDDSSILTYKWTTSDRELKQALNTDYSEGIGGTHIFHKVGEYELTLSVTNTRGITATDTKTIKVRSKGEALLNLEADNTPKKRKIIDNNVVSVEITAEGTVQNNIKDIVRLDLLAIQAPKDYTEGDYISIVNPKVSSLAGNHNSLKDTFTFNVNTGGDEYTQYFKVMFVVNYRDGSNEFVEQILKTKIYKEEFEEVEENKRPIVHVVPVPPKVKAGEETKIYASADDEDGKIVAYEWYEVPSKNLHGTVDGRKSTIWFEWSDEDKGEDEVEYRFKVKVWDNGGKSDSDTGYVKVLSPTIEADLNCTGTFKENRLVTISAENSTSPEHYPITEYDWTITALGNGADVNSVRYDGELDGSITKDIIFKKSGRYKIRINVRNRFGYSDSSYQILNIVEDKEPICSFDFVKTILREPSDNNYASFNLEDNSVSVDGDIIAKRVWLYTYDSDNDGSYADESYHVFENGRWRILNSFSELDTVADGNKTNVVLRTNKVGKYNFELYVKEEFGQPTIQKFITNSDKKSSKSF